VKNITQKKVLYNPSSVALFFGGAETWDNDDDIRKFNSIWGTMLDKKIRGIPSPT
jgi:hypothetical protein